MITPAFALTATERVLPKLALDFTTAALDSRVTFTRTTGASNPATYTNSSGFITSATNNQPRFDYDPVTLVCKGLLIEEARTNLLTYSDDFRDTAAAGSTRPWFYGNISVTADAVASPSNNQDADKLVEDSANSTHRLLNSVSGLTSSATYAVTVYAKQAERPVLYLQDGGVSGSNGFTFFNLATGVVTKSGNASHISASMTNVGNGWYRCTLIYTVPSTATAITWIFGVSTQAGLVSYQGNGTSGLYLWGAQLEAGAFATSYIPTTTAALTRNADNASMTGTNFSSWYNASQGTLCFDMTMKSLPFSSYPTLMNLSSGSAGNELLLYGAAGNSNVAMSLNAGGANVLGGYTFTSFGSGSNSNVIAMSTAGLYWSNNGTPVSSTTISAMPSSLNAMYIGSSAGTGNFMTGWVESIRYFPQKVTDAETQSFSK